MLNKNSYDIINKNLEKLNSAYKVFPNVLPVYASLIRKILKVEDQVSRGEGSRQIIQETQREINKLSKTAEQLSLNEYISFIKWIETQTFKGNKIVYTHSIQFDSLKQILIENSFDDEVKELLKSKIKKGMITFLNSEYFWKYNGGSMRGRRRGGRKYFRRNFENSETIIMNFLIQNESVTGDFGSFGIYYRTEISNFETGANIELKITNEITKSLIKKIESLKYDFRRLNFNLLKSEIETTILQKIKNVEVGEKIRCIEEQNNITLNKVYDVISYNVNYNGILTVTILSDANRQETYNYRNFENVSKLREDKLESILSFIE